jgi:hypothetical protein
MEEIKNTLSKLVQDVIDGNESSLTTYAEMNMLKKHIEKCMEEIKEEAQKEADSFNEKTFVFKGFEFTKTEGKRMYDFKNVQKWVETKSKLSEIEELAKQSANNYAKLKTMLVTEDGEVVEPCVITYSKPSISVKLKK